jgi:hypothetical protein
MADSFWNVVDRLIEKSKSEFATTKAEVAAFKFRLRPVSEGGVWRAYTYYGSAKERHDVRGATAAELVAAVEAWSTKYGRQKAAGDSKGKKVSSSATQNGGADA